MRRSQRSNVSRDHVLKSRVPIAKNAIHDTTSLPIKDIKFSTINDLEQVVLKLVDITNGNIETAKQPSWWPDQIIPFHNLKAHKLRIHSIMLDYHKILLDILRHYSKFHMGKSAYTRLLLKFGFSNTRLIPVVKLRDILSSPPASCLNNSSNVSKEEFLNSLKLQPTSAQTSPSASLTNTKRSRRLANKDALNNSGCNDSMKSELGWSNSRDKKAFFATTLALDDRGRCSTPSIHQNSAKLSKKNGELKRLHCRPFHVKVKRIGLSELKHMKSVEVLLKRSNLDRFEM